MRILLVEDSALDSKTFQTAIKQIPVFNDHLILTITDNLAEAKKQFASADIIVMDLNLRDANAETTIDFINAIYNLKPVCIYTRNENIELLESLTMYGIGVIYKNSLSAEEISKQLLQTELDFQKKKITGFFEAQKDKLDRLRDILRQLNE